MPEEAGKHRDRERQQARPQASRREIEQVEKGIQAALNEAKKKHAEAKKDHDTAVARLLQLVDEAMHPADLPLFDRDQRETDQQRMEAAAASGAHALDENLDELDERHENAGDSASV